jgi:hypothetical protein
MNKLALSLLMTAVCLSASTALVAQPTFDDEYETGMPEQLGPGGTRQIIGGGGKTDTPAFAEYGQYYGDNKAAINTALGATKDSLGRFFNTTFGGTDGSLGKNQIDTLSKFYAGIDLNSDKLSNENKALLGLLFKGNSTTLEGLAKTLDKGESVQTYLRGLDYNDSVLPNGSNRIPGLITSKDTAYRVNPLETGTEQPYGSRSANSAEIQGSESLINAK